MAIYIMRLMSLHIWATRSSTLSYTLLSQVQVQTSLLAFPRSEPGGQPISYLGLGEAINFAVYCGSDKTEFLDAIMVAQLPDGPVLWPAIPQTSR